MLVAKICLTGGPCGGKTSALQIAEDELKKCGFEVIIINETATELVNNNEITGEESDDEFAKMIVDYQRQKELQAIDYASHNNGEYVIICDRSIIEPSAYVGIDKVNRILQSYNTNFEEVRDSYDLVIHLTTAAKGAREHYSFANNEARKESLEEAENIDDKILEIWNGHKNRAIESNENICFDEKIDRVVNKIVKESIKRKKFLESLDIISK